MFLQIVNTNSPCSSRGRRQLPNHVNTCLILCVCCSILSRLCPTHERTKFQTMMEFSSNGAKDVDRLIECFELSCDVVLIKTCRAIEGKYVNYLSSLCNKRVQPVGSLIQDPIIVQDEEEEIIMEWLEKKGESSVVFVSFGSEYFLSDEEREEIAHGLEVSEVNFIWVVRFPLGEQIRVVDALPKGFNERIGERGLVVENWAPQAKILGHSSVGGFVSHCGWNSIMESVNFGVPLIAMPMHLDQPLNARVVEAIGVGLEVKRGQSGKLDREDIARVIRSIVVVEKNEMGFRRQIREMGEKIMSEQENEIDEVVKELVQLCGQQN